MGARFSARPDRPWGQPSLLYNGYRVFPGGKVRPGRAADHSPLLMPRSWKSRAIPLPPSGSQPGLERGYFTFHSLLLEAEFQPQGYNAAGRIMSMKNDTIGNRTCDLPAFWGRASTNCATAHCAPVLNCSFSKRNSVVFCVITVNVVMLIVSHDCFSFLNLMI
jgi:hypothetical protein